MDMTPQRWENTSAYLREVFGAQDEQLQTLRLNRLEAACLPSNTASTRVLTKAGFRLEGRARRYLKIDGCWQDHDLYALLHDDPRPGPAGA